MTSPSKRKYDYMNAQRPQEEMEHDIEYQQELDNEVYVKQPQEEPHHQDATQGPPPENLRGSRAAQNIDQQVKDGLEGRDEHKARPESGKLTEPLNRKHEASNSRLQDSQMSADESCARQLQAKFNKELVNQLEFEETSFQISAEESSTSQHNTAHVRPSRLLLRPTFIRGPNENYSRNRITGGPIGDRDVAILNVALDMAMQINNITTQDEKEAKFKLIKTYIHENAHLDAGMVSNFYVDNDGIWKVVFRPGLERMERLVGEKTRFRKMEEAIYKEIESDCDKLHAWRRKQNYKELERRKQSRATSLHRSEESEGWDFLRGIPKNANLGDYTEELKEVIGSEPAPRILELPIELQPSWTSHKGKLMRIKDIPFDELPEELQLLRQGENSSEVRSRKSSTGSSTLVEIHEILDPSVGSPKEIEAEAMEGVTFEMGFE